MGIPTTMTLTDLLSYLRQQLIEAADHSDASRMAELQGTLVLLQEAAWEVRDERRASLIEDMIDAARDALVGVEWKSDLPSLEAIRATEALG